jgi:hypothetical protein
MIDQTRQRNRLVLCFYLLAAIVLTYPIWSHNGNPFRYDWDWPIFNMREFWSGLSIKNQVAGGLIAAVSRNATLLLGLPGLLNISPTWCLKIFMIFIHTAAGYGFYLFISSRIKNKLVAVISGLLYAFTPYVFIRTIVGFIFSLLAYAVLPYFLNLYLVKDKRLGQYIILGLLLSLIFSQTQAGLLTLLLVGIYALVSSIVNRDFKLQLKSFFLTILFWLLSVAPWIVIVLIGSKDASLSTPDGHEATTLSFIAALPHSFKRMFMMVDHHITQRIFFGFADSTTVMARYSIFYLVAILSIFSKKNRALVIAGIITIALILPLFQGPVGFFGPVYIWIYNHFSPIAVFRETYHLQFIIAIVAITLFAIGADFIYDWVCQKVRPRLVAILLLVGALGSSLVIIRPYFSFDYFKYLEMQHIPPAYQTLHDTLENTETCSRIYYPPGLNFIAFKGVYLAANSDLLASAMPIPYLTEGSSVLSLPSADTYYRNELVSQFYEKSDKGEFVTLLAEGKIDCVIVRTDLSSYYFTDSNLAKSKDKDATDKWLNNDLLGLARAKKDLAEVKNIDNTIYIFKPTDNIQDSVPASNSIEPFPKPESRDPSPETLLPLTAWANNYAYYKEGWARGRYDFWHKHLFTQARQDFILTDKPQSAVSGAITQRGNYDLWARYYDGGASGSFQITVDQQPITVHHNAGAEKIIWRQIGSVDIKQGNIEIVNLDGENAIFDLVIVPAS